MDCQTSAHGRSMVFELATGKKIYANMTIRLTDPFKARNLCAKAHWARMLNSAPICKLPAIIAAHVIFLLCSGCSESSSVADLPQPPQELNQSNILKLVEMLNIDEDSLTSELV